MTTASRNPRHSFHPLGMIAKMVRPNTIKPSIPPREKLKSTAWTMKAAEAAAIAFCHHLSECRNRKKARPEQVTSEIA